MIYLDNAATSFPKPKGMAEAMMEHMVSWCGNPGRSGHQLSRKTAAAIGEVRENLADFIGAEDASRILFTHNATTALNLAIHGILRKGDHVITTSMEHNSVLRPVIASGAEYTIVQCDKQGHLDPLDIQAAIRHNTRMIICTHASNVTGTIMPIQKLRHRGILLLVDASQSLGHIPVSVGGVDMLAAPGHKGLMGPMGTGFLYVRPGLEIHPLTQGGTGTYSKVLEPPLEFPESFEAGTLNAPGIIGLGYSLRWLRECRVDKNRHVELMRMLDENLRNMKSVKVFSPSDCYQNVGIVTFNIDGWDSRDISSLLDDEFGIATRAGFHCAGLAHKTIGTWDTGAVRLSLGMFNNLRQMQKVIDAVYRISKLPPGTEPAPRTHGCRRS